jgi:hypothetical protein
MNRRVVENPIMVRAETCVEEPSRLDHVRDCMTNFLLRYPACPEWANVSLTPLAVAYSCGALAREGDRVEHDHDPAELALCRRVSAEAARVMDGVEVGMGSGGTDYFAPFFVAANRGQVVPDVIDEAVVRRAFGGTLHPVVEVVVEPLEPRGEWWTQVREYLVDNDDAERFPEELPEFEAILERWVEMIEWFRGRPELHGCRFVMTREREFPSRDGRVCLNFPYLALGITAEGSLVGIWGVVVR